MKGRIIRKAALCLALGACLGSMAPMAIAQSVTGAVAGRANTGEQITVTNSATGQSRTITVGKEGTYRVAQLPPGDYTLVAGSGAPVLVTVSLGGTTTVNLNSEGAVNLDAVQVIGSRVVNRVDVYTTETATNINREELARLPVDQSLARPCGSTIRNHTISPPKIINSAWAMPAVEISMPKTPASSGRNSTRSLRMPARVK